MNEGPAVWPLSLRLIHWVTAVLVLSTLVLGVYMVQLVHDPSERFDLTQKHKSIGVLILFLTIVRLCLRLAKRSPAPEPVSPLLVVAAKAAHIALYGLLLVMVFSGWLMTSTTPVRIPTLLGAFELPYPLAPNLAIYRLAHSIHAVSAAALASLIAVHVAATLVHGLLWRDRTFLKMSWYRRST